MIVPTLTRVLRRIPPLHRLARRVDEWLCARYQHRYERRRSAGQDNPYLRFARPGHYYSTIPDRDALAAEQGRIFSREWRPLPGITISDEGMLALMEQLTPFVTELPYSAEKDPALRFHLNNGVFERGEATVLQGLMRLLEPRRIIEVGSGLSSCLMLDVNERHFDNAIRCTFIDPAPERLVERMKVGDRERISILERRLQDVDLRVFQALEANDIAFFDSTHVSKCDSDVNHILFDVLPSLQAGVYIHFHDVFYPFEYPEHWLLTNGVAWNEDYMLRAFLEFNEHFEITFFNDYFYRFHRDALARAGYRTSEWLGSSLWLRKR